MLTGKVETSVCSVSLTTHLTFSFISLGYAENHVEQLSIVERALLSEMHFKKVSKGSDTTSRQ